MRFINLDNFLILLVFVLGYQIASLRSELATFRTTNMWDVEKARRTFIDETDFAYTSGCLYGANYPPEYRQGKTGFNNHSPMMYCADNFNAYLKDYFQEQMRKIGHHE